MGPHPRNIPTRKIAAVSVIRGLTTTLTDVEFVDAEAAVEVLDVDVVPVGPEELVVAEADVSVELDELV